MFVLAIHDGHNASVALFQNGSLVYAIQEERLSRVKNHWGAPNLSIQFIVEKFQITLDNLEFVLFAGYQYTDRLQTTRHQYTDYTRNYLSQKPSFISEGFRYLKQKSTRQNPSYSEQLNRIKHYKQDLIQNAYKSHKCKFVEHHCCHLFTALAGFTQQKHENGVLLTLDGFGDGKCGSIYRISDSNYINKVQTFNESLSFAKVYAWTTVYLGFTHLEHEYKLMGLAPYADPNYTRPLADSLHMMFSISDTLIIPNQCIGGKRTNVNKLFAYLTEIYKFQRFDVICGALQLWLEETLVILVQNIIHKYSPQYIGLSGGLFMNVKLNQVIRELLPSNTHLFIFPSCGDETNVFGAAYSYFSTNDSEEGTPFIDIPISKQIDTLPSLQDLYLGSDSLPITSDILNSGEKYNDIFSFELVPDINSRICHLLDKGEIVARVCGREEFGARALGNRSLLCNPSNPFSKEYLNDVIKSRDFWMPFAGSLREENASSILVGYSAASFVPTYMIMTYDSIQPADYICSTHPRDKTIRPQIVTKEANYKYWDLLNKYEELTGQKVLLNTSLNLHGLPVAHSLEDLALIFTNSGLKYIAVDDILLTKKL